MLKETLAAGTRRAGGWAGAPARPGSVLTSVGSTRAACGQVAAPVVRELRLALLAPAELSALEEQNRREPLIPVRTRGTRLGCVGGGRGRGQG